MQLLNTIKRYIVGIFDLTALQEGLACGLNSFTHMPSAPDPSAKLQALKAAGTFNPRSKKVRAPLFERSDFFDPQDLPQLKYEAVRALQADQYSISRAADEFGLSRPTIYQAQDQLKNHGLEGLLARKRGPKKPHKLTADVRDYLHELIGSEPGLSARELVSRLRQKFKLKVHPRTIEKALKTKAKRGLQTST